MITYSSAAIAAIKQDSRRFDAKLYSGNTEIECEIRSIRANKGACGTFNIGSLYTPYVDVTVDGDIDLSGGEFLLKFGVYVNGAFEDQNFGYFTPATTKIEKTLEQTSFTAYGRLAQTELVMYDETGIGTRTLANIKTQIETLTGYSIVTHGVTLGSVEVTVAMTNMTCKEAIGVLASVVGGFATEDNSGNIVIAAFSDTATETVTTERMTSQPKMSDSFEVESVMITVSDEYEDEEGTIHPAVIIPEIIDNPTISIRNAYMNTNLYTQFATNIVGFEFNPSTIPLALGDPRFEPWDCLSITDTEGGVTTTWTVPCMALSWYFDGALTTTVSAQINVSDGTGPLSMQIAEMSTNIRTSQIAADIALAKAQTAKTAADSAQASASAASVAATQAQTKANQAIQSASAAATAAESAQTDATAAATAASNAGKSAAQAQAAAEAVIEASYRLYNRLALTDLQIASICAQGYYPTEGWARSNSENYYQGACVVGDVLIIEIQKTDHSNAIAKLLVRVAIASASGAVTYGAVISYSDNIFAHFWHDVYGAHILGEENGYRTDLNGSGMQIVNAQLNEMLASFGASGTSLYRDGSEIGFFGVNRIREDVELVGISANNGIFKQNGAMVVIGGGFGGYRGFCFVARNNGHMSLKAL